MALWTGLSNRGGKLGAPEALVLINRIVNSNLDTCQLLAQTQSAWYMQARHPFIALHSAGRSQEILPVRTPFLQGRGFRCSDTTRQESAHLREPFHREFIGAHRRHCRAGLHHRSASQQVA